MVMTHEEEAFKRLCFLSLFIDLKIIPRGDGLKIIQNIISNWRRTLLETKFYMSKSKIFPCYYGVHLQTGVCLSLFGVTIIVHPHLICPHVLLKELSSSPLWLNMFTSIVSKPIMLYIFLSKSPIIPIRWNKVIQRIIFVK